MASGDPAAVKAEAAFLTADQPALFQPNNDWVAVWKKNLSGPPDSFADLTQWYSHSRVLVLHRVSRTGSGRKARDNGLVIGARDVL